MPQSSHQFSAQGVEASTVVGHRDTRSGFGLLKSNAAGIDIGASSHWVSVPPERAAPSVREFGCYTPDLEALVEWLRQCNIETVAMESTGVYWIALYELLEREGFEVILVNAQHLKHVPGRKSDVLDCQWIHSTAMNSSRRAFDRLKRCACCGSTFDSGTG